MEDKLTNLNTSKNYIICINVYLLVRDCLYYYTTENFPLFMIYLFFIFFTLLSKAINFYY